MTSAFKHSLKLDLPVYPFADLERKASAIRKSGKTLYNLSIGDPDLEPPDFVVDAVKNALDDPKSHFYPSCRGDMEVRKSVARWFKGRFGVSIDPETQVCLTIGCKEALSQIAKAVVDPGDIVAVPEPSYPVYGRAGCKFVDGKCLTLPLTAENNFLPDLSSISNSNIKLLYLNYPNNPTGAEAPETFLKELGKFVDKNPELTLAYDMAYSEMYFGYPPHSILEFTPNAIEFHSLSKMASATGYRIGFAVGEPSLIAAFIKVKEEIDSGAPYPFQKALSAMLDAYEGIIAPEQLIAYRSIYQARKSSLIASLEKQGISVYHSNATFYLWFFIGGDEMPFINKALQEGLLLTPGSGFGKSGKGWVRASVTAPDVDIEAAANIIAKLDV
jgi:LL-diaminopimelate aminotransferase